jgi:small-conductance mechanosensitive channel
MLGNFAADGLEFTLVVWIADPEAGQLGLRSEININILRALRQAGIDIPYPQRVVRMQ